jgi:CDP-diacylglycerol--glycerol-3-phosphate 3-phosphatidyltransferase
MSTSAEDLKAPPASPAAEAARDELRSVVFNLPNQLTWLRLILSVVLFALIGFKLYLWAMVVFLLAAGTDFLDGYLARKWKLVTTLGRILDPFADKVVVCGTFIYLAAIPDFNGVNAEGFFGGYLWPSMAVIVVARELLVTALRSFMEQQGADFSAEMAGKLKMVFQCAAAALSLYVLHLLEGGQEPHAVLHWTLLATIWTAVAMTVYSGVEYIVKAVKLLRA